MALNLSQSCLPHTRLLLLLLRQYLHHNLLAVVALNVQDYRLLITWNELCSGTPLRPTGSARTLLDATSTLVEVSRRGLDCFVHHSQYYEALFDVAAKWRDSVRANEGTLERPSRAMRELIIRRHQQYEIELRKRDRPAIRPTQGSPSTLATINHFYVGQPQGQEPSIALPATLDVPQLRQVSPVPVELNTTAS